MAVSAALIRRTGIMPRVALPIHSHGDKTHFFLALPDSLGIRLTVCHARCRDNMDPFLKQNAIRVENKRIESNRIGIKTCPPSPFCPYKHSPGKGNPPQVNKSYISSVLQALSAVLATTNVNIPSHSFAPTRVQSISPHRMPPSQIQHH